MFDGFSLWHLLILFIIIVLVFGSKKLVSLGPDLGKALRGFKQAMHGEESSIDNAGSTGGEKQPGTAGKAERAHDAEQQEHDSDS